MTLIHPEEDIMFGLFETKVICSGISPVMATGIAATSTVIGMVIGYDAGKTAAFEEADKRLQQMLKSVEANLASTQRGSK